jgi:hypothetical protein
MTPLNITLLFVSSFVIAVFLHRHLTQRAYLKQQYLISLDVAATHLDERARKTLAAYEHYFDCGIPQDLLSTLLELNLIRETIHPHKYVITQKGYDVGVKLELFGFPHNVYPA